MNDVCFSPSSLALLISIGGVLQGVIVTLFWLAIRAQQDSIKDARDLRDRALDINEEAIRAGERSVGVAERSVQPRRGKRS